MVSQAEALIQQADAASLPIRYLIRDRDGCYSREFDEVFEKADVLVEPTAPRAPNQNAYIERWIGSLKYECLNRFITFGLRHLDYIVGEYASFYNELRPHQRKDNRPLTGSWLAVDEPLIQESDIVCETRLGGVLKNYERMAA
ncbi:integrase core domain-containing protein [Adhaeretor mobilis]|uniref:Integrase core domain protein n=1 Tax=Adhaeretor mobilis TaxID=1930276 RepID=A0A517MWF9_9BACT|nr:integrase core domain-containing protein [Adhaeretor mobilis]QDS99208.1 Integrase core domain protein [Adhaeretor mobilis]